MSMILCGSIPELYIRTLLAFLAAEPRPDRQGRVIHLLIASEAVEVEPTTWHEHLRNPSLGPLALPESAFRVNRLPGRVTPERILAILPTATTVDFLQLVLRFLVLLIQVGPADPAISFVAEALAASPAVPNLLRLATQPLFIANLDEPLLAFATRAEAVPAAVAASGIRWSDGRTQSVPAGAILRPRLPILAPGVPAHEATHPFLVVRLLAARARPETAARLLGQLQLELQANMVNTALLFLHDDDDDDVRNDRMKSLQGVWQSFLWGPRDSSLPPVQGSPSPRPSLQNAPPTQ